LSAFIQIVASFTFLTNFFSLNCLFLVFLVCYDSYCKWCIFQTATLSQSPPFGRTCGGQEVPCPQRRENMPICEKIAKTRRSSSEAQLRRKGRMDIAHFSQTAPSTPTTTTPFFCFCKVT